MFLTILGNENKLVCTLWQGKERLSDRVWRGSGRLSLALERGEQGLSKLDESFYQEMIEWLRAQGAVRLEAVVWQNRHPEDLAGLARFIQELSAWAGTEAVEIPLWWEGELPELARYSGFPGINRRAVYDRVRHEAVLGGLSRQGRLPNHSILADLGEATTIAAYAGKDLLDCNNARDGEGPMGLSHSGSLPTEPLIHFACHSGKTLSELEHKLSVSGWAAYQGILTREQWEAVWLYQVLKEIGAMQAALKMKAEVVFATGSLSRDFNLMKRLSEGLPSPLSLEVVEEDLSLGLAEMWFGVGIGERGRKMLRVEFDEDRCKGCELCTAACPQGIIVMAPHLNAMGFHPARVTEQERCISCAFCARMCPDVVITVRREEKKHA